MRFIADENMPLKVIEKLKKEGIDIKLFLESIKPHGIILLRIRPKSVEYIFEFLRWILIESKIKFDRKFIVIKEDEIREIHI